MADAKAEAPTRAVESLVAEKEAVAQKEEELVRTLNSGAGAATAGSGGWNEAAWPTSEGCVAETARYLGL